MIGKDEGEWFDAHMQPVDLQAWTDAPGTVRTRAAFEDDDGTEYIVDFTVPEDQEQLLAFLEQLPGGSIAIRLEES